ncbi:MAG: SCP2 sterol-binding domain-containing protein [Polyangiaceae bacterium]|nr:SCP2 sterol-binding domain-containing protein [Myxococcales bacterium]MCB9586668.1 SCP2 sterol-binding domain-containing protein [Polyangiaceae bacterium]MCB9606175.1 SCP2 sterol-binding domain-containing protein [Polyangiaceae bacterium]
MVDRIDNCQQYFDTIQDRFIADQAKGVEATYVYELSGNGGGTWTVSVKDQAVSVSEGSTDNASVTYTMKADDYVKLANGDLGGAKAVMTRKLKVSGSIPLARKMNNFLPPLKG